MDSLCTNVVVGEPATSTSPRDIFLAACSEIVARLSSRGYRYAKSGPHARKKSGVFTHEVSFQSSHNNAAGVCVKLWVHGKVLSKTLEAWRKSYPELHAIDYVAGGQIGNLIPETNWCDWDLARESMRQATVDDAVSAIETVALPYFAQFDDLDSLIHKSQTTDIPSMTIDRVIEFLMCFADQGAAEVAASNFLKRRPDLVSNYHRDFARYAERGLQYRRPSGYAAQLAFASHLFKFGDLTGKGA